MCWSLEPKWSTWEVIGTQYDLINILIHSLFMVWCTTERLWEFRRWDWVERKSSTEACFVDKSNSMLHFKPSHQVVAQSCACHHYVLPQHKFSGMKPSHHRLKMLKLWVKISQSSIRLYDTYCNNKWKMTVPIKG